MVVDFGNIERVYGNLVSSVESYVNERSTTEDMSEDMFDLMQMGDLQRIPGMTQEQIDSTLRYLVETSKNFEVIEDDYDATVLMTILSEYKIEWMNGTPIYSTTWGGFVSAYENLFTV